MWNTLPEFGTIVLCGILVAACFTFAVALAAGRGRPRLLKAARSGAYGTVALVALAVLVLAYAFVTHDFRLSYVARYSDRTMTTPWLIAALWGGQDGSLLWWLFLTAFFSGACVMWLKGRYRPLQPYVIATLMSVLIFLGILMLFGGANPFSTVVSGPPPDGEGLNYQLRNFYMIIHPPSLYIGFTSCAVPFAFAIAALATGRLDNEWINATRKWMLFSWLFLSIGNALGMLWAYDELGWGGYWAWDPVENAAFLPWLTASAYVHSTMIQERRGMLRMWNIILICLTFLLTYFGTFLTRSGLIASVHSFARSGIGEFFAWYMVIVLVFCIVLIGWRALTGKLESRASMESVLSREVAFVINNWILLLLMVFIAVATVWPRISEALWDTTRTIGPGYYNMIIPPFALLLIFLMGTAPLLGWRKTSEKLFINSFALPVAVMGVVVIAHLLFGATIGYPPFVEAEPVFAGRLGAVLAWIQGKLPVVTVALVAYNFAVVFQEFKRGIAARRLKKKEPFLAALFNLMSKSRRRYGGYIVHVGIAVMFFGFAGRSWGEDAEASLKPGETMEVGKYLLQYRGPRMEVDHEKRIIFADLDVYRTDQGADPGAEGVFIKGEKRFRFVGEINPAKYIYKASPGQPSTEVSKHMRVEEDLYVIIGIANPQTKVASFQVHVNPLVNFVWLGVIILILGCCTSLWPEASAREVGVLGYVRAVATIASAVFLSVVLALAPSQAHAQQQNMNRDGVVQQTPQEKALFSRLLCNCGSCPHEALATCTCPWAHTAREDAKAKLKAGETPDEIVDAYARQHGEDSVILRASDGANQIVWMLPIGLAVVGAFGIFFMIRTWRRRTDEELAPYSEEALAAGPRDEYEDRLDQELRDLDE